MTDHLDGLRPYQRRAVLAAEAALAASPAAAPVIKAATGAGKSMIIASLALRAADRGLRVLVLAHREELIVHNSAACDKLTPGSRWRVGQMLASMGRRQTSLPITVAMVQTAASFFRKERPFVKSWDLVLIDEAHRVPLKGGKGQGQYLSLLNCPQIKGARLVGLSATPSRLGEGAIYPEDGDELATAGRLIFSELVCDISMTELVELGFLSPLAAVAGRQAMDMTGVKTVAGEFSQAGMSAAAMAVLPTTIADILDHGRDRRCWLIFASSVAHGEAIANGLRANGITVECVTGDTERGARRDAIAGAQTGRVRALVNCEVLTTGTDIPICDMVVLARATKSAELYVQMIGRGARLADGKTDCLVLDIGGNYKRHGEPDDARSHRKGAGKSNAEAPVKACEDRLLCPRCRFDQLKRQPNEREERQGWRSCPGCGGQINLRHGSAGLPPVRLDGCQYFNPISALICRHCLAPFGSTPRKLERASFEGVVSLTSGKASPIAPPAPPKRRPRAADLNPLRDALRAAGVKPSKAIRDFRAQGG